MPSPEASVYEQLFGELGAAGALLFKAAVDSTPSYDLHGKLYASPSGWLLLSVPNALVRGAFDALHVPGAILPPSPEGTLNAHISVMNKKEVDKIGVKNIRERGHHFAYKINEIRTVQPDGWDDISRVWMFHVTSPELCQLRRSYGLSPEPKYPFHITIACRKKRVFAGTSEKSASVILPTYPDWMPYGLPGIGLFPHILPIARFDPAEKIASPGKTDTQPSDMMIQRITITRFVPKWHQTRQDRSRPFTVAVDLDGTILEKADYPKYGDLRPGAKETLQKLRDRGCRIIVFTCKGDTARVAQELDKHKVPYDYINENPHQPPGASGKVMADVYVDDRGLNADRPWEAISEDLDDLLEEYEEGCEDEQDKEDESSDDEKTPDCDMNQYDMGWVDRFLGGLSGGKD